MIRSSEVPGMTPFRARLFAFAGPPNDASEEVDSARLSAPASSLSLAHRMMRQKKWIVPCCHLPLFSRGREVLPCG